MRRTWPSDPRRPLCRVCECVLARPPRARSFSARAAITSVRHSAPRPSFSRPSSPAAFHTTARWGGRAKQTPLARERTALPEQDSLEEQRTRSETEHGRDPLPGGQPRRRPEFANLADIAAAVDRVTKAFLAQPGVPSEQTTLDALRACAQSDVKLLLDRDDAPGAHAESTRAETTTVSSHLLDLDRDARTAPTSSTSSSTISTSSTSSGRRPATQKASSPPVQLDDVVDKMSQAAYIIVTHPPVVLTPRVLDEYVKIQAQLGKPETLPQVLALYASKPVPSPSSSPSASAADGRGGAVRYAPRNPARADSAVESDTADAALAAAIEAKDLDAAVGIVEHTYAAPAFARAKLLRRALLPCAAVAATPPAAYLAASRLAPLQSAMDEGAATLVAFAGILAYVGFTASMGLVAAVTANDHMRRVTWAPGTPLRQRWLREEERAAYDRVACSFGFSESHRYGEEEGQEFQTLRQFLLRKGMLLDAVELMEGMN